MPPEELWETTMNPANRKLIQVTTEDLESSAQCIDTCMGKNIEDRKDFIFGYLVF